MCMATACPWRSGLPIVTPARGRMPSPPELASRVAEVERGDLAAAADDGVASFVEDDELGTFDLVIEL